MADESSIDVLKSIDRKLSAIITLLAEAHVRASEPAKYRSRSVERILTDLGMPGSQVGHLLGKSQQAVSQALARERKSEQSAGKATGGMGARQGKKIDGQ